MIDYKQKYQRKENPEWTAEGLVLENDGRLWYTTEDGESMWCYERQFSENYEPIEVKG